MLNIDIEEFPNFLQYVKLVILNSVVYIVPILMFFYWYELFIFFAIGIYALMLPIFYKIDFKIFLAFQTQQKKNKAI